MCFQSIFLYYLFQRIYINFERVIGLLEQNTSYNFKPKVYVFGAVISNYSTYILNTHQYKKIIFDRMIYLEPVKSNEKIKTIAFLKKHLLVIIRIQLCIYLQSTNLLQLQFSVTQTYYHLQLVNIFHPLFSCLFLGLLQMYSTS